MKIPAPIAMLAELTHRCPLSCPYCSNPVELARQDSELDTETWVRVFDEAAKLGVLQLHLSGGEPASRRDLVPTERAHPRAAFPSVELRGEVKIVAIGGQAHPCAGLDAPAFPFKRADPFGLACYGSEIPRHCAIAFNCMSANGQSNVVGPRHTAVIGDVQLGPIATEVLPDEPFVLRRFDCRHRRPGRLFWRAEVRDALVIHALSARQNEAARLGP